MKTETEIRNSIQVSNDFLAHGDQLSAVARQRHLQVKHTLLWVLDEADGPVGPCHHQVPAA